MDKSNIIKRILNGKIILFGCGEIAAEFYAIYQDRLQISYVISNNPKEKVFSVLTGMEWEVHRPSADLRKKGDIIILCSRDYKSMAEQLQLYGYEAFVDFVDYEFASVLLSKKKIVLYYGFCHLRGIRDYLEKSKEYSRIYVGFFYPNYLFLDMFQQRRLNAIVDLCELVVYGMAVTPENQRKNAAILSRINKKIQTICVPAVYFGGYFPQMERQFNYMNPYAVKAEGYDYTPFSYGDSWLNYCIDKGMDFQDVMKELASSKVYDDEFIQTYLEDEWKRLKFQEKQSDIKILEYIQDNFRKRRLFRNEAHMENEVLKQYAFQILEKLGLKRLLLEMREPLMRCSQHFIYPCVAETLGLEWDVFAERLELYTYSGWRKVSVKEYVELYLLYCRDIKYLKNLSLFP